MKRKFWNWIKNEDENVPESRTLFLHGEISDETWFGDEVTPGIFRDLNLKSIRQSTLPKRSVPI